MKRKQGVVAWVICLAALGLYYEKNTGTGLFTRVSKVTAVTYVYEQREGDVPNPVEAALSELNSQDIVATSFDVDTTNGTGGVPKQYEMAVAAAREKGLPTLVATSKNKVVRIMKAPKTKADVMKVAK